MFLAGTFELSIDSKNRLSIPFAIRRKLSDERDGHSFYIVPGRRPKTLALYPEKYYERVRADQPGDDVLSEDTYEFRQFEYAQSALVDPDSQGRVLIPDRLLKRVGIDKDAVLIAVRDHLELWHPDDYAEFENRMWSGYADKRSAALQEMNSLAPAKEAGVVEQAE